jgi:hypothetical protein
MIFFRLAVNISSTMITLKDSVFHPNISKFASIALNEPIKRNDLSFTSSTRLNYDSKISQSHQDCFQIWPLQVKSDVTLEKPAGKNFYE